MVFGKSRFSSRLKSRLTNLTKKLGLLLAIVPHKVLKWSITRKTATVFRNITFAMTEYWFNGFVITLFIVADEILPIPFLLIGYDFWELINLKLLVLWRVRIIESPLLKRNVSTDKVKKYANNLLLVLNVIK